MYIRWAEEFKMKNENPYLAPPSDDQSKPEAILKLDLKRVFFLGWPTGLMAIPVIACVDFLVHPPREIQSEGFSAYLYLPGPAIASLAAIAYPNNWRTRVLFALGSILAIISFGMLAVVIGILFFGLDPAG